MDEFYEKYLEPDEEFIGWFSGDTIRDGIGPLDHVLFPDLIPIYWLLRLIWKDHYRHYRVVVSDKGLHIFRMKPKAKADDFHTFFEFVLIRKISVEQKKSRFNVDIDFAFNESMSLYGKKAQWNTGMQERPLDKIFDYAQSRCASA